MAGTRGGTGHGRRPSRSPRADLLEVGDTARLEALAKLTEARQAFTRAGRSDSTGLIGSAASWARQAHHVRAFEPAARAAHDPADWFLN